MLVRKNVLPHTLTEILCCCLITAFIPITFVFELTIVLPEFHEPGSLLFVATWLAGLFLLFNLQGNMIACMIIDTSIKQQVLKPPTDPASRKLWRLCAICETLAPPRSWHCNICNTCILRRDHHCLFTGCCVGHKNHRYFIMFMIYILIGSGYATAYNSVYFWYTNAETFANWTTYYKMIFPLLMFTLDTSWKNFYLLIYELNVIAVAYSLVLLIYHGKIAMRGGVIHEGSTYKYDLGWRRNLKMILGDRMHLVWVSPFLISDLPHDGAHWELILKESTKNI